MADFRRVVTALAVLALLTGFAVTANAQVPAFACVATAAVPPLLRAEGVTELVGDIVLNCTNGVPAVQGSATGIPTANFQVFVGNTNVTSRLISGSLSEALLLVDEPAAGAMVGGGATGCGAPCAPVTGTGVVPNVYQGIVTGNSVTFLGVPVNPPGTTATRVYRITNVRINASAIGAGAGFVGSQVLAFTSISGSTSIPVNNPQQIVGFVQQGLNTSLRNSSSSDSAGGVSVSQCVDLARDGAPRTLRFSENFATAFKTQGSAAGLTAQDQVGLVYNTESGLTVNPAGLPAGSATIGVANFGTRLRATFRNMPTGVSVYVSTTQVSASSTGVTAALITNILGESAPNPAGTVNAPGTQASTHTISSTPAFQVPLDATGTGSAVWEVTAASPLAIENLDFRVWFSFTANPGNNVPPAGVQGTVSQSFAPTGSGSSWTGASSSLPIPRFVDLSTPRNIFVANICRTTLLFPFVSAADGFDTGLAIANTSADTMGTTPQTGTCTLNFFGSSAPSALTTAAVAGGTVYVNVASAVAPGFRGYMIAVCNFQYAHGFAFVQSTVGYTPSTAAMGYLALVMYSRPLNPEALDN